MELIEYLPAHKAEWLLDMVIWAIIFALLIGLLTPTAFLISFFRKSRLTKKENSRRRFRLVVVANIVSIILGMIPLGIAGYIFLKETDRLQAVYSEDIYEAYGLQLTTHELTELGFGRYVFITGPLIGETTSIQVRNSDGDFKDSQVSVNAGDGSGNYYLDFS